MEKQETGHSVHTHYSTSSNTGDYWPVWGESVYNPYPCWKLTYPPGGLIESGLSEQQLAKIREQIKKDIEKQLHPQEVDIMFLYRVYLVYAADRKNPQIVTTGSTVAKDEEDAKIKSGVYAKIQADWDPDYITIVAEQVAEVRVKAKAQEVKQV